MPAICATYTDGFFKMQASNRQHSNFGFLAGHDPVFLQLAMEKIYAMRHWTTFQRKWLARLAKQLNHEVVIDEQFVDQEFEGGAKRLNIILHRQLDAVLETLSASLWEWAV